MRISRVRCSLYAVERFTAIMLLCFFVLFFALCHVSSFVPPACVFCVSSCSTVLALCIVEFASQYRIDGYLAMPSCSHEHAKTSNQALASMISPVALNHRRRSIRPRAAPPGSALEHGSDEQVTLRIHGLLLIFTDCSLDAQKCPCACDHRPCASIECSLKMKTCLSGGSFCSALTLASD